MAVYIPKIEYGDVSPTVIQFESQELGYGEPEQLDTVDKESVSISGVSQVSVDHILNTKRVRFAHLSTAKRDALGVFYRLCAGLGKPFRYYEDSDSADYKTYQLKERKFSPKRTGIAGDNDFWHQLEWTFKRVDDLEVADYMEAVIENNQAVAADVEGLILDHTLYQSVKIFFGLYRKTDDEERVANGYLTARYLTATSTWDITPTGSYVGDDDFEHGLTFSMDGSQVQYVSDNMPGANYSGRMTIKNLTL